MAKPHSHNKNHYRDTVSVEWSDKKDCFDVETFEAAVVHIYTDPADALLVGQYVTEVYPSGGRVRGIAFGIEHVHPLGTCLEEILNFHDSTVRDLQRLLEAKEQRNQDWATPFLI